MPKFSNILNLKDPKKMTRNTLNRPKSPQTITHIWAD